MEGDVVVVCPEIDKPKDFVLWVKGKDGLETKAKGGVRQVSEREVVAVLTNGFFTALRPVRIADLPCKGTGHCPEPRLAEPLKEGNRRQ